MALYHEHVYIYELPYSSLFIPTATARFINGTVCIQNYGNRN